MKRKKIFFIILILAVITIAGTIAINAIKNNNNEIPGDRDVGTDASKNNSEEIPDGYIAVFHGGSGEITYETYIYKKNNGKENYGFDYINVTSTTTSWGASEWKHKITKRGFVEWTDDVFGIAEKNNAYSYVTLPNSEKTYTIQEYKGMFLMN